MTYRALPGLKIEDYSYPGERDALDKIIRSFKGIAKVLGEIASSGIQATSIAEMHGNLYRVNAKTCPHLDDLFQTAKKRLDIDMDIPLFIKPMYEYNAFTTGTTKPVVCIASFFVKNSSDDTVLFILGHELGHIKSEHLQYSLLANCITSLVGRIPLVGDLIDTGLGIKLYSWKRMQEFSCDRAGAIATGGADKAIVALQTLLGINDKMDSIDASLDDLLEQYEEFEAEKSNPISKGLMLTHLMSATHPWTIDRIYKMNEWGKSGEFETIVRRYISANENV